jgi:hypothetical protein
MLEVARRPERDRRDLFRAVGQALRLHEAVVEKDFWVCWVLDHLFEDSPWREHLVFKGGTSLSKAYAAIERFSEDIDLVLDWRLLGYADGEPWHERGATRQDAFGKEANRRAEAFLVDEMAPALETALAERLGAPMSVAARGADLLVGYPRAFSLGAIRPEIRLEVGPLAAWVPNERRPIQPYAAEAFPKLFSHPRAVVPTVTAERTFWEKATILHQEAHRSPGKALPPRYSRHYYDLYRLGRTPIRAAAIASLNLLEDVAKFKMRFYRCTWARYELARPGGLRLLPPEWHHEALRRDYQEMRSGMLFGDVPTFDDILEGLSALEREINSLNPPVARR